MRFKDFLEEQKEKHAVLAFGRMNPPTTGHEVLVNKVKDVAEKHNASHHIVLSHSQDKSKNPLTAQQKVKHAKRYFPGANITVATKEEPNFLTQAAKLHKSGVTHLHMVAGSDRVGEYHKLLHKYNGTHEGALFNFKGIKVHSAGERDPDAEGTSGMSASKMRGHAAAGEFHHFKKGIPSHVPEHHAKELYNDVRKGMNIKEGLDGEFEEFTDILSEGVHDKGIFKAVFLGGGPGSGKDYILSRTLDGHGLTEINSDKALEFLMDKNNLDMKMPDNEKEARDTVRGKAKSMTELKQRLALFGRNGLIINGTGDDPEKIARIKDRLEQLGYESSMIMVNTRDEVSAARNVERGQTGGRTVPEEIRKSKWDAVQNARPELAKLFGDNYNEIDNSEDLRQAPPEVRSAKEKEFLDLFKKVQGFVKSPSKNDESKQWIANELQKKDTLEIPKGESSVKPHPDSGAAEQARKLGLQYYGFGRYGQKGKVTYRSVHDKLMQVNKPEIQKEDINQDFENIIFDSVSITESNDEKFITDKYGKVRIFQLRSAAAREAHQKNGSVQLNKNTKQGGYIVKLHEENNDVSIFKESILQENRGESYRTTSEGATRGKITLSQIRSKTRTESTITESCCSSCEQEAQNQKTDSAKTIEAGNKTTAKEIKLDKQTEKVKESIDMGTEPGLSMASSGENLSRGLNNKNKVKEKPLEELTGDETTKSIGDQKEDESSKSGINLSTFKSKRTL